MKLEEVPRSARALCGACRTDIIWTKTVGDHDMPVDLAPGGYVTTGGDGKPRTVAANLRLTLMGSVVLSQVVPPHLAFGNNTLHLSHFVRCPQAKYYRRGSTAGSAASRKNRNRSRR